MLTEILVLLAFFFLGGMVLICDLLVGHTSVLV